MQPFLALITPLTGAGGGGGGNYPDQGLPMPQPPTRPPGYPSHPIYYPPYPDQGLPPFPSHPIAPGGGGQPPYPDQGLPPFPSQGLPGSQPRPDNTLPGGQGGRPTHPIYLPVAPTHPIVIPPPQPVYPDQGLPGSQPHPDQGLPGEQPHPDQGLPPIPGLPPTTDDGKPIEWKAAWLPQTGWIVVGIPQFPHPTPSA